MNITDAFKGIINAPIGKINDRFDCVIDIIWVNKIRHAKLFGQWNFGIIEVNPNDAGGADHFCALNHIQANSS